MHKELAECGTSAAYRRHRRAGEDCAVCREAEAVRGREKRQRRREASDRELLSGASVVVEQKMRAGTEPVMLEVPTGEDPLVSARWRLAKVRASMELSTPRDMAALAKREEEIVELIASLAAADSPKKVSALDQLAEKRAQRLADASG